MEEPVFREANCLLIQVVQTYTIAIYRSLYLYYIDTFILILGQILSPGKNPHCLIKSDIKLDIKDTGVDQRAHEYLDLTIHFGYIPGHTSPTRGSNCLDHCLIKFSLSSSIVICHSDITNNSTVLCSIGSLPAKTKRNTIKVYKN